MSNSTCPFCTVSPSLVLISATRPLPSETTGTLRFTSGAITQLALTSSVTLRSSTWVSPNSDPDVVTMQNPSQFGLTQVELRKVTDEVSANCVIAMGFAW